MKVELRVWWIPQVPMEAFLYPVPTIEAGKVLLDALAEYDAFQFQHRVKPDYCNTGGIAWKHPEHTGGEWYDFDPDDEDDLQEIADAIAKAGERGGIGRPPTLHAQSPPSPRWAGEAT